MTDDDDTMTPMSQSIKDGQHQRGCDNKTSAWTAMEIATLW